MNRLNIVLQKRDLTILEFVAKFGIVNDLHLLHIINSYSYKTKPSTSGCEDSESIQESLTTTTFQSYNRIINRLISKEYLNKTKLVANEFNNITLGKNGASLTGSKPVKQLVLNKLRHDMLVLDLYCKLMIANPNYNFTSEHELKQKSPIQFADKTKIPDLLIYDTANNDYTIAVEMELSEKHTPILSTILLNYIQDSQINEVWYLVKSKKLGDKIYSITGSRQTKIRVFLIHEHNDENRKTEQINKNGSYNIDAIKLNYTELSKPLPDSSKKLHNYNDFEFFDLNSYLAE